LILIKEKQVNLQTTENTCIYTGSITTFYTLMCE
jgi:hypothetical protein